jgi:hypothetical protein
VLKQQTLFGTDFLINLLWSESYNHYLAYFLTSPQLSDEDRAHLGTLNPARFLFG